MKNGWKLYGNKVSSWFVLYVECNKRRENNSYQVYIKLCYFYVLVLVFSYKVKILSTFDYSLWNKKYFCHGKAFIIQGNN
jgi:hypothetical protein